MIKDVSIVTLLTASLIATIVRMFFYLIGGNDGSYLRESIRTIGATVIILEVCIVMLRFFNTFYLMDKMSPYIPKKYQFVAFIFTGIIQTYILTTLPGLFYSNTEYKNDAIMYLSNRPFELLPIFVEYLSLYVMNKKIVSTSTSLSILCTLMISLIVALRDVQENGNTIFQVTRSQPTAPKMSENVPQL